MQLSGTANIIYIMMLPVINKTHRNGAAEINVSTLTCLRQCTHVFDARADYPPAKIGDIKTNTYTKNGVPMM